MEAATPNKYGGLGLGLVIARTLVEMHQGQITASSDGRGKGAMFIVQLPLASAASAKTAGPVPALTSSSSSNPPSKVAGKRILLVEDHKPTLLTLQTLLQRRGYQVTPAAAAEIALQHAALGAFDLVISDIGLPDSTGYDLMNSLRARHGLKGVAMSGYGADTDRARSRA
jgi:CheY-like chemotaxis protein